MYQTYILILKLNKNLSIEIGKLGNIYFKRGFYIYIGSSKRNIEKRVERHIKNKKKVHWHIDYLTLNKNFSIKEIYFIDNIKECKVAEFFIKENVMYIKNFGSSDCNCKSHLFYFENLKSLKYNIKAFNRRKFYEKAF